VLHNAGPTQTRTTWGAAAGSHLTEIFK